VYSTWCRCCSTCAGFCLFQVFVHTPDAAPSWSAAHMWGRQSLRDRYGASHLSVAHLLGVVHQSLTCLQAPLCTPAHTCATGTHGKHVHKQHAAAAAVSCGIPCMSQLRAEQCLLDHTSSYSSSCCCVFSHDSVT
jgi:hypothetical protein